MSELVPLVCVAAAGSSDRRDGRLVAGRTYGLEPGSAHRVRVGTPPA